MARSIGASSIRVAARNHACQKLTAPTAAIRRIIIEPGARQK
jgi:hypothetical protein